MADLKTYFPDVLREFYELQKIAETENPELLLLKEEIEKTLDDQFIDTARETGIAKREKMLRLSPKQTDTLEERRFRILSRYNENIPYTLRVLHSQLAILCGEKGYLLEINYRDFVLKAKLELTSKKNVDAVGEMLERIVPVNMLFAVSLLYNQHQMLKPYRHQALSAKTHFDLREEVLENG